MIIIHTMNEPTLPRLVAPNLQERLSVMPAVVVTGARQTRKSTLAQELTPGNRRFLPQTCLTVSDILHKAVVKNDEEGTEAAAVTAIMMRNESTREPLPKATLKLNRPFLFMIMDLATRTTILIGRVGNP